MARLIRLVEIQKGLQLYEKMEEVYLQDNKPSRGLVCVYRTIIYLCRNICHYGIYYCNVIYTIRSSCIVG